MEFYGPNGARLNRSAVVTGFNIYDAVSDRIAAKWSPKQCPIEEFKSTSFDEICSSLDATPREIQLYVRQLL